jgi:hypothetical protein
MERFIDCPVKHNGWREILPHVMTIEAAHDFFESRIEAIAIDLDSWSGPQPDTSWGHKINLLKKGRAERALEGMITLK